jgi:sugar lactone lactonase YvrE
VPVLIVLFALLANVPFALAAPGVPPVAPAGPASPDSAAADTLPLRLRRAATVVSGGGPAQRLGEPAGVAVDAFGRLFVSDAGLNQVQCYDAKGGWLGSAGTLGSDPGQLRRPVAVATVGNFGIAVLDRENRRVVSYDLHGRLVGTLIDLDAAPLRDQLGYVDPVALAADRGGAVIIADADHDRLLTFDFGGRYVRSIGGFGGRGGSFRSLSGVACAPRGELVTSERAHGRIQRLDAGGRVLAAWPLAVGLGRGALAVAVDDSSRIAVADELTGRLWIFDATGRLLAVADGCAGPRALAFAPDGTLLVAESRAGRVTRWSLAPAGAAAGE